MSAALGFALATLSAAEEPDIVADRPRFGASASAVDRGRVQVETGGTFTRVDAESRFFDLPEALVRVGLGHALELRATAPDRILGHGAGAPSGWSDVAVGLRAQMNVGQSAFAARASAYLPSGSAATSAERTEPEVALAWSRPVSARWSLASTVSVRRLRLLHETLTSPSLSLGRSLGAHLTTFVEYGAAIAHGTPTVHRVDHGYAWLLNPRTQLDASLGLGLSQAAPDFFVGVGYCRRF